jgi:drug/metabolite transporter (DMT)-like permease
MSESSKGRCFAALAFVALLWASAFPAIRRSLAAFSPFHLALFRFLVASAVFVVVALVSPIRIPHRQDWGRMVLVGLASILVYHSALNYGQKWLTAGAASFIVNTVPIMTGLMAARLLHERIPPRRWMGMILSFGGIGLIAFGQEKPTHGLLGGSSILIAAVAQSSSFILQKPLLKKYTATEIACYSVWIGTILLLVAYTPGFTGAVSRAPRNVSLLVVYLGIFPAALATIAWTYVLKELPASRAASFLYVVPPLALCVAWLWLGEVLGPLALTGCALALSGVVLGNSASLLKTLRRSPVQAEAGGS